MLSGKGLSQSKPVIYISCNKPFLSATYDERNPNGSSSVEIFFRKLCLLCSLCLQQGAGASLKVNTFSFASHNIPKVKTEGSSPPYFKLTSIVLSSSGISFKTFDSINIDFCACIPAFPIILIIFCIVLLLHHWS